MQVCTTEIDLLFEEIENQKRREKLKKDFVESSVANEIVCFFVQKDKCLTKRALSKRKKDKKIQSQYSYSWKELCYIIEKLKMKQLKHSIGFKIIKDEIFSEPYYEINFECYL